MKLDKFLQGIVLTCVAATLLTGCAGYKHIWPHSQPLPGTKTKGVMVGTAAGAVIGSAAGAGAPVAITAIAGGIAGGTLGDFFSEHEGFAEKLDVAGVTVAAIGEDLKIILPSDRFLFGKSTKINPAYYPVLDGLAEMLRNYTKETVKVAGYTDDKGCRIENLAISREQAQTIANYLMRHHIDARMIYSIGYGDKYPLSSNLSSRGRSDNRRVEITLRRIPDGALV